MGCKQSKIHRSKDPPIANRDLTDIKELKGTAEVVGHMLGDEVSTLRKRLGGATNPAYVAQATQVILPFAAAISKHLYLNFTQTFSVLSTKVAPNVSSDNVAIDISQEIVASEAVAKALTGGKIELIPFEKQAKMIATWLTVDKDSSGTLNLPEITKLVNTLNVPLSQAQVKTHMAKVDKNGDQQLNYQEFKAFFAELTNWDELKFVFNHFSDVTTGLMTLPQLQDYFMRHQGGQVITAADIVTALGRDDLSALSLGDFGTVMSSATVNNAMHPSTFSTIYHDMTQPLWHYFMNSSHNTYLSGNQFDSYSQPEMYKITLLDGCRCVELDCWDGPDGKPIVYHGYTRTSKISFESVITAIRDSAFQTSLYPITLSLEVHTSEPQQTEMARVIKQYLGENVVTQASFVARIRAEENRPTMSVEEVMSGKYLTPYRLKKCVIVKGKCLKKKVDAVDEGSDDEGEKCEEISKAKKGKKEVAHKLSEALSDLVFMPSAHLKGGLEEGAKVAETMSVCSFVESKSNDFTSKSVQAYADHNKIRFARIYPAGSRVTSTNYDPVPHWASGAQVVALNWQTRECENMRVNLGNFRDNGGCGYLLKPLCLREPGRAFDDYRDGCTLTVSLLSAFMLPKEGGAEKTKGEIVDPYVIIKLTGAAKERGVTLLTSPVIDNNGYHPVWASEKMKGTHNVSCKELCLVRVEVWDKDMGTNDDLIAEAVVPLRTLRQGVRAVSLTDKYGVKVPTACILLDIKIDNAAPSGR